MRSQIDKLRTGIQDVPAAARAVVEDPRTSAAAWWTFGNIFLSMIAAIAGAIFGAGPQFVLARWQTQPVVWEHALFGATCGPDIADMDE